MNSQSPAVLFVVGFVIFAILFIGYRQWTGDNVESQIATPTPPPAQCLRHSECPDGTICAMNGTCVPFTSGAGEDE